MTSSTTSSVTSAAPAGAHIAHLARGAAVNLVGAAVASLAGFALVALITRNAPEDLAGSFFAVTSLFLLLEGAALLGADTGLARYLPRLEVLNRRHEAPRYLKVALWPVLGAACACGLLLFAFAGWAAQLISGSDQAADVASALRAVAVLLPFAVLSDSLLSATRAFGFMGPTVVIDKFGRSAVQPLAVVAVLGAGAGLTAMTLAWGAPYLISTVAAALVVLVILRRQRAQHVTAENAPIGAGDGTAVSREFWSYTWPRAVARLCQIGLQRIDIILVAVMRSPAEAAIYTAATRFVILGQLGVQAVQQVLQPRLSRLLAEDDARSAEHAFQVSTGWIMVLSWPVYIVAAVAAPIYLMLFGPSYAEAGETVTVVLAVTMLLATAAGSVDVVLLMAGRSRTSLVNNALALLVNVGLNLWLIPAYGIAGAAVAHSAALVTRNALPFWQVWTGLGMTALGPPVKRAAIASLACFALPLMVLRMTAGLSLVGFAICLSGACIVYTLVLWRSRGVLGLSLALAGLRERRGT